MITPKKPTPKKILTNFPVADDLSGSIPGEMTPAHQEPTPVSPLTLDLVFPLPRGGGGRLRLTYKQLVGLILLLLAILGLLPWPVVLKLLHLG